jgi:hypothetical protein
VALGGSGWQCGSGSGGDSGGGWVAVWQCGSGSGSIVAVAVAAASVSG